MNTRRARCVRGLATMALAAVVVTATGTAALAARPSAQPALTMVQGTVTWAGQDTRATLVVLACRVTTTDTCADMRTAAVDVYGHYRLSLASGTWKVAPLVDADGSRVSTEATTVTLPRQPRPLDLTIAARVARVRVVDAAGNPFAPAGDGTGGTAGVVFCDAATFPDSCPEPAFGMGVGVDHDGDGWLLLAADPVPTYRFAAYARTGADSTSWSYSEPYFSTGADLDEDHTFVIP